MTMANTIESTCRCAPFLDLDTYCAETVPYSSHLWWFGAIFIGVLCFYIWAKNLQMLSMCLTDLGQYTRDIKQLSEGIGDLKNSVDRSTNSLIQASIKLDDILGIIRASPFTTPNKHPKRRPSPISFAPISLTFHDEV